MLKRIKDYCLDSTFRFSFEKGQLDIENYTDIVILEEDKISIRFSSGVFIVRGKDLSVRRLLDQEMLISGDIKTIELG